MVYHSFRGGQIGLQVGQKVGQKKGKGPKNFKQSKLGRPKNVANSAFLANLHHNFFVWLM
jgi:hypothetical protein